ncbi:putative ribonuclease H-like domain-containing protein [Tanacetum coccineum]|uniref:Ribonuclease H-like domain-containing protein n=1 Tax=Tanacetum coccineum TaxID=301880 RepID=A0ABQ5DAM7_9ASTR
MEEGQTAHAEDEDEEFALMAFNNASSDTKCDGILSYEYESFVECVLGIRNSSTEDCSSNVKVYPTDECMLFPPMDREIHAHPGPNVEIDESQFPYGPKQPQSSESKTRTSDFDSYHNTCSHSPNVNKKDRNGSTTKRMGLGYGFTRKACYVCGSFSHLIRDCNFHENRMAKQAELNKRVSKGIGPKENRPVWNNMKRMNHQNQFVPTAVLTRTGKLQVNTAKTNGTNKVSTAIQNINCQAVPTSAGRKVNTVKPKVNDNRPKTTFHKVHSYFKRPFQRTTATKTNFSNQKVNTAGDKAVSAVGGFGKTVVKASTGCNWRPKKYVNKFSKYNGGSNTRKFDDPQRALKNKGIVDSGCSRHMTGNKAYLVDYQDYNGGHVAFGGSKGQITGKVSQMCDKKNKVLFTDTECLVLSPDFKLPDENQVLLRVPRQHNMYSFNLENIVPSGGLACLIAKVTIDESNKWHRRLGHVNFKNLNKLVKGNLVRGLPSKIFQNDHTCVACQKGKQHKASYKAKVVSSISQPLQLLHMDLFGPTSVRSLNHKTYYLVITDDFSRFSWVFFLRTKDETSGILKDFISQIENQLNHKVKVIRCDNGTEFKNREMNEFCKSKGIKREFSNARTPQQNGEPEEHVDQVFLDELEQLKRQDKEANDVAEALRKEFARSTDDFLLQAGAARANNTNPVSTDRPSVSTDSPSDMYDSPSSGIFTKASYDDEGAVADFTNLESVVNVSPIPTSRIHTIHPTTQILGDPASAHCLFACFLSQVEPKKISDALEDESWVNAMQEELMQFKIQEVVRNKARLVAQGHRQEERIDYDEVFAPVARIEAIRIFLAFASYMGFIYDDLLVKLNDTAFKAATYKRGLATLEDQIVKYKEHEVLFSEEVSLLKRSVGYKEYELGQLKTELEKVKQEKEGIDFKIAKFDKSAKDLFVYG